jgi:hypothetical protein
MRGQTPRVQPTPLLYEAQSWDPRERTAKGFLTPLRYQLLPSGWGGPSANLPQVPGNNPPTPGTFRRTSSSPHTRP